MSYSIYLRPTQKNGDQPDCPDPTYNLTEIFDLALTGEELPDQEVSEAEVVLFGKKTSRARGLRLLNGKTGEQSLVDINHALDRLADERLRSRFVALEPENKWGDIAGAVWVMRKLRELATEFPHNKWEIR
jgi:hypothetical protein